MSERRRRGRGFPNFRAVADAFPPCIVRFLAKDLARPREGLADAEIAVRSGLSLVRVRDIARMTDWDAVTIGEYFAFTSACSFDPSNVRDRARWIIYQRVNQLRKKAPLRYLKKHPKWESEFLPLAKLLRTRMASPMSDLTDTNSSRPAAAGA